MRQVGIFLLSIASLASGAYACDPQTGERVQHVFADWNGSRLGYWNVEAPEPQVFELSTGLKLGILIQEATAEKYADLESVWPLIPERVSIRLYDMSSTPPTELSMTWGGANSVQGFSSRGGANRVDALGLPGLRLHLLKSVCAEMGEH